MNAGNPEPGDGKAPGDAGPPGLQRKRGRRFLRLAAAGVAFAAGVWYGLPWLFPIPEAALRPPVEGVRITDRNGEPLRRLLANGMRAEGEVPLAGIPEHLIRATLAAEDSRFFSHGGVDFPAIVRAAGDGLRAGRTVSGASTVTQQLVKICEPRPRTLAVKIVEALKARRLEMGWSKERILEAYLNRLDYGNLCQGPVAAAAGYFAKPLSDCSLAECAFLAALPQAPTRLNPWRRFPHAQARQQWILKRMAELGWIPEDEYRRAAAEKLVLRRSLNEFEAPHFVDLLLQSQVGPPARGTWRTTLDLTLQRYCEQVVRTHLDRLRDHNVTQAAVVVMDSATAEVLALVGSRDFSGPSGQVNGATARRSPGSALKPFTYLLALQNGYTPASIIPDLPVEYMTPTGIYRPKNYDSRAVGPVSVRTALANSLNLCAVRLLEALGGVRPLIEALRTAGITTLDRPESEYGLGLTIGGGEVTLLELTSAYSCLARMGVRLNPVLTHPPEEGAPASRPEGDRIFDPDACWMLADILSDNSARIRSFGMRSPLRFRFPVAVKTGTSTDYRDNWTLAYTPRFTVGVWAGNFDNSPMRGVSGVTGAAPILREIVLRLEDGDRSPPTWYPVPPGVAMVEVDPLTGLPVPDQWHRVRPRVREIFRREQLPLPPGTDRYDAAGRVLLPPVYAEWLAGPDNWLGSAAAIDSRGESGESRTDWRISHPLAGTTLLLDPDIPGGGTRLPLAVSPPDPTVQWSSDTLRIDGTIAVLTEGRHRLTATDATGRTEETWIQVRRR